MMVYSLEWQQWQISTYRCRGSKHMHSVVVWWFTDLNCIPFSFKCKHQTCYHVLHSVRILHCTLAGLLTLNRYWQKQKGCIIAAVIFQHNSTLRNNVETSYFTQLKMCYQWQRFDVHQTSWSRLDCLQLDPPGNHLVPCVAELVGSCIPILARRCLPDPKCLFYPSDLSLCLSDDHFCLVPVDDMVLFHGMVCDGYLWVTLLSLALEARVCVPAVKESTSFLCSLILRPNFLPVSPT